MYDQEFINQIKESLREALEATVEHNPDLFKIVQGQTAQNFDAPGAARG
jgi:hypothetical protein